ncbi:MAG: hypothetical protein RJA98_3398 [Pseudomonadota bacterium]
MTAANPTPPSAPPAQGPITWSDTFLLGHAAMDATHREFVDAVAALQRASDDQLSACLDAFATHAVAHFGDEQRWMDGTAFPAAQCHADEHAAVLASVREVQGLLSQGVSGQVARDLAQALADWFPGHADYMDAPLSHWLSQRSRGGAPVVLRRGVAQSTAPSAL